MVARGNHKIHFKPLLVAEVIQLPAASGMDLRLDDFGGDKPLEEGA